MAWDWFSKRCAEGKYSESERRYRSILRVMVVLILFVAHLQESGPHFPFLRCLGTDVSSILEEEVSLKTDFIQHLACKFQFSFLKLMILLLITVL